MLDNQDSSPAQASGRGPLPATTREKLLATLATFDRDKRASDKWVGWESSDLHEVKCEAVYQHVYDSYYGQGASVYGSAA